MDLTELSGVRFRVPGALGSGFGIHPVGDYGFVEVRGLGFRAPFGVCVRLRSDSAKGVMGSPFFLGNSRISSPKPLSGIVFGPKQP